MKLYWRIRSLPELEHLTKDQRSQLLKSHVGSANLWMMIYAVILGSGVAGCVGSFWPWQIGLPIGLVAALVVYLYQIRTVRVDLQMQIIEMYRGRQLPICLKCGYDLRKIETSMCPECGSAIHVKNKQSR